MKPIIVISASYNLKNSEKKYFLHDSYVKAIRAAGGIPLLIPITADVEEIKKYIYLCDGLILPGGEDVSPIFLKENPIRKIGMISLERDSFEFELLKEAKIQNKPVLGICKGCQLIALDSGGKIYQDIYSQCEQTFEHSQSESQLSEFFHTVLLEKDSFLYKIFGKEKIWVNSWHHQAVKSVGNKLKIISKAEDGIIEGIESTEQMIFGVQWHPELLFEKYPEQLLIYKYFIKTCKKNLN